MGVCFDRMGASVVNKKQTKTMKKGYREAGQIYWTDEMTAILKALHRKNYGLFAVVFIESVFIFGFILRGLGVL